MWGTSPVSSSRAPMSVSSSVQARAGSSSAQPSAIRAESQFHWCGYVDRDGTV